MKQRRNSLPLRILCIVMAIGILSLALYVITARFGYEKKAALIKANDEQISKTSAYAQYIPQIKGLILQEMQKAGLPGYAIAIVHGNETVYQSGFGYADMALERKVTAKTLFQLASNSKAFTGLGLLCLQKDGLVNLDAPVTDYLPWLTMTYQGKPAVVRISDFLHHTSGISPSTISKIPVDDKPGAIERTVRTLIGTELVSVPGQKYQYATINYDVLGLLIEKLSGMTYEDYLTRNVLSPMGLTDTHMVRDYSPEQLATGYKLSFGTPSVYAAPSYDGNKPAGYMVSNVNDLARWVKIQMGSEPTSTFDNALIQASHIPNTSVQPMKEGYYYAAGWRVSDSTPTEVAHSGSNPNYSSNIAFLPEQELGVVVLSNSNSYKTSILAMKIMDILAQRADTAPKIDDLYQTIDFYCTIAIAVLAVLCCILLYGLFRRVQDIRTKKRAFGASPKVLVRAGVLTAALLGIAAFILLSPHIVFNGAVWSFVFVWYPNTVAISVYGVFAGLILGYACLMMNLLFKGHETITVKTMKA
ncbi:serine hydrolase domain-containing protein [Acetanaerobacterium elongatum]|uniref:CubicO group peptidase, beta-lactamase class C family n=1 Tax=Acetanaerobacterium elongatum TaxID=258515 RepID=A0A1G9Z537_9FIRM|nr:serine hydrolase domain-containing protein [Acetanaerobacterium elongatum]SDN16404.1 CubicO group peptidase, beta-lactamase class C family [Acetanaerobacterium elongatum]